MIISLFGPDGAGKSLIADRLSETYYPVFSGTSVANWPDRTWYNELVAAGVDDATYDDPAHFLEKIRRAHALARQLEQLYGAVVIDSDPLHKTHMYDILQGDNSEERFSELFQLAKGGEHSDRLHIHVKVSRTLPLIEQAKILQERIGYRSEMSVFDPRELSISLDMISANDVLHERLGRAGERVVVVYTDEPFDPAAILEPIQFA